MGARVGMARVRCEWGGGSRVGMDVREGWREARRERCGIGGVRGECEQEARVGMRDSMRQR